MIFDIESDGLLNEATKVHCLVMRATSTGKSTRYSDHPESSGRPLQEGLEVLMQSPRLIGHNAIKFDIPLLKKLYPHFKVDTSKVIDTLVYARLVFADIRIKDAKLVKSRRLPGEFSGLHSLEAWGHRLNLHKGDYAKEMEARGLDPWAAWNQDMEDYCEQDTAVTLKLFNLLETKAFSEESITLEHEVAWVIARQERYGFQFNEPKAVDLYGTLVQKKLETAERVRKVFGPKYLRDGKIFTPKRDNSRMGYVAGSPVQKIKLTEFNPGSRDHIAYWLKTLYGWVPTEFTADGKPKVDDDTLMNLPYPEAEPLKEYLMLVKRCGQIAEGKAAWLKCVSNGRMHGSVNTNGAVTGRMTHSGPNMAQVPAGYSPYGKECRELFEVRRDKKLVGIDAAALELRCLAGYMAAWDNGAYIKTVLEGDKSKGTDIHSVTARGIGLDPVKLYFEGESGRDIAKTWFYAFIYGAQDPKLGEILTRIINNRTAGHRSRMGLSRSLPALGKLTERVKVTAQDRKGILKGLDGRLLSVRGLHAALNTLLQGAGAAIMKRALVIFDNSLQSRGYLPGVNYEFVANVHDEWQVEVDEGIAEEVGKLGCEAIRLAGEYYNFRCPLSGEYKIGNNWSETH
ncbi:DNA polymerase [Oxalobacter vibrioformis]|uniref:DNA polymerase n=1 Tax=Oxalobacter vibrioformis TaxID=933080 RepID=A0A9E9P4D9_9BURK|nr:DNA polymerase [Oxalobacter vibrioformis]WAW09991.1 DNA polymerase [Oxalobacter vibrioformis]